MKKTKYIIMALVLFILVFPNLGFSETKEGLIASLKIQIQTILEQIQLLQIQLLQLQGGTVECNFTRPLYPGLKGEDVQCLQKYLNSIGYTIANSGYGFPGNESIYYGSLTQAAVRRWQQDNNISYGNYPGYFGPKSQAKYNALIAIGEQEEEEGEEPLTYCGDNIIQQPNEEGMFEVCDKNKLNNQTCQSLGYASGTLSCSSSCLTFNTSKCVRSSGAAGGAGSSSFDPSISAPNRAPTLSAIGNKTVAKNNQLSLVITATDPDNDDLIYTATNLPSGSAFNSSTRTFSWTPSAAGTHNITLTVSDGELTDSETIIIIVNSESQPNDPPEAQSQSIAVLEDDSTSIILSATDLDGDTLTYTITSNPSHGILSGIAPNLTYTPNSNYSGIDLFTFRANDDHANSNTATISITITPVNDAPVLLAIGNKQVNEGQTLTFAISATDMDGDTLFYSVQNRPTNLSLTNQTFTFTPNYTQAGTYNVTFIVSDGELTDSETIIIIVTDVYQPSIPVCGDGACNGAETCSICSQDCGACQSTISANYYVDGRLSADCSDYNPLTRFCGSGTSIAYNTIQKGVNVLKAGDILMVREGIYRENHIQMKSSGTENNRITVKNYPGEKPIIDGSVIITGWRKCSNKDECLGNSNWQKIYYVDIPSSVEMISNFMQGDRFLNVAQYPNPAEWFFNDRIDNALTVPRSQVEDNYIIDQKLNSIGGNLTGSHILVLHRNNGMDYRKILNHNIAENKLTIESITPYADGDTKYSIINHYGDVVFDSEGEYYLSDINANGNKRLYVRPFDNIDLKAMGEVTRSVYGTLFDFQYIEGRHDITVEGFVFQKAGSRVIQTGWDGKDERNIFRNNEVRYNYSTISGDAIYAYKSKNFIIENNYIHDNKGYMRGLSLGGERIIVKNNIIDRVGGDAIWFSGCNTCLIMGNTYSNIRAVHTNGIAIYENSNKNILIANNRTYNNTRDVAFQRCENLGIYNNVYTSSLSHVLDQWDTVYGTLFIANNLFYGQESLLRSEAILKNNIMGGGGAKIFNRGNNIYLTRAWDQSPEQGWNPKDGEIIVDGTNVYGQALSVADVLDLSGSYPMLVQNSLAINKGTNPLAELPAFLNTSFFTNNYNFNRDIDGNLRGSVWDIGPYKSNGSAPVAECTINQTRSCSTGLQGICNSGIQTCQGNGLWGPCVQNSQATAEICGDNIDNDCDGKMDCNDSDCAFHPSCQSAPVSVEIPAGYISYWKFENNTNDEIGSNIGDLFGNASFANDSNKGNVLALDGSGDYFAIDSTPSNLRFTNSAFTVSYWANPSVSKSEIFGMGNDDVSGGYACNLRAGTVSGKLGIRFLTRGTTDSFTDANDIVNMNQWNFITCLFDGTNRIIYLNGNLVASENVGADNTINDVDSTDDFRIGSRPQGSSWEFGGFIDDALIYNKTLSESEIQTIYNAQKPASYTTEDRLTGIASMLDAIRAIINNIMPWF